MRNKKVLAFEDRHWRRAREIIGAQRALLKTGKGFQTGILSTIHILVHKLRNTRIYMIFKGLANFY